MYMYFTYTSRLDFLNKKELHFYINTVINITMFYYYPCCEVNYTILCTNSHFPKKKKKSY